LCVTILTADSRQQTADSRQQTADSRQQIWDLPALKGRTQLFHGGFGEQTADTGQRKANSRQQTADSRQRPGDRRQQTADDRQQTAKHAQYLPALECRTQLFHGGSGQYTEEEAQEVEIAELFLVIFRGP
jgi:hypothetical protein